jgi:hypothetical protein
MLTKNELIDLAQISAATAVDQAGSYDYPTLADSVDAHLVNLIDTLQEKGLKYTPSLVVAIKAFYAQLDKLLEA